MRPLPAVLAPLFRRGPWTVERRAHAIRTAGHALYPVVDAVPPAEMYCVAFSGGKDSIACVLHLLEAGVAPERIELWHHLVDPPGRPFMDWPCTAAYCQAFADALALPILFSGRVGGFEREMLREGTPTAPVAFEVPGRGAVSVGGQGPPGTRLKFPQVSADLSVRWCSAYLKIDVGARVFSNDPRFTSGNFVLVSGERAEESPARAKYATLEEHRASNRKRRVMQWRPVHGWSELHVWAIFERWGVVPHPAYRLGFGRLSCMSCIFGNAHQWASVKALNAAHFEKIARYEEQFGVTIKRDASVRRLAAAGTPYTGVELFPELAAVSQTERYDLPILTDRWELPLGAFRKDGGPT